MTAPGLVTTRFARGVAASYSRALRVNRGGQSWALTQWSADFKCGFCSIPPFTGHILPVPVEFYGTSGGMYV